MRWPFTATSNHYTGLNPITTSTRSRRRSRSFWYSVIKWTVIVAVSSILIFLMVCRVDMHLRIYPRTWVFPSKAEIVLPLSNDGACFKSLPLDSQYFQGHQPHAYNIMLDHRGQDDTCYGFASITRPRLHQPVTALMDSVTLFHTTWSSKVTAFSETQLATLRSFAATQDLSRTQLIVWIDPSDERELINSPFWQLAAHSDDRITYKKIDWGFLASETPLENAPTDSLSHYLHLLILNRYGGVWFDLNTFFIRDMTPLLERDWIAQGNCFTSVEGNPFQGAGLLHFRQNSPYMCELIQAAAAAEEDLATLYYGIYRRILHNGFKPWAILPWCFTDPSQCKKANSIQSPFSHSQSQFHQDWLDGIFAYHWHDKWPTEPSGTIFDYLSDQYKNTTRW